MSNINVKNKQALKISIILCSICTLSSWTCYFMSSLLLLLFTSIICTTTTTITTAAYLYIDNKNK